MKNTAFLVVKRVVDAFLGEGKRSQNGKESQRKSECEKDELQ